MKQRHYYLILCGCLVIIIGYFFILKPQWMLLKQLREDEQVLKKELNDIRYKIEKKGSPSRVASTVSREYVDESGKLLSGLAELAEKNGLVVGLVMHLNSDNRTQIKMTGTYQQISGLMRNLVMQKLTLFVEDFSIKVLRNGLLQATLDIIAVLPVKDDLHTDIEIISDNVTTPFCHPGNKYIPVLTTQHSIISTYSVRQMRWRGSINTGHSRYALIALPNGNEESVREGDMIGLENLRVVAIKNNELQCRYPDNREFKIKLDATA